MDNLTDYTDAIGALGGTATGLLGALNRRSSGPSNGSDYSPAPAPAPAKTNWVLIGGIGAAVLVVIVLILSVGGRK